MKRSFPNRAFRLPFWLARCLLYMVVGVLTPLALAWALRDGLLDRVARRLQPFGWVGPAPFGRHMAGPIHPLNSSVDTSLLAIVSDGAWGQVEYEVLDADFAQNGMMPLVRHSKPLRLPAWVSRPSPDASPYCVTRGYGWPWVVMAMSWSPDRTNLPARTSVDVARVTSLSDKAVRGWSYSALQIVAPNAAGATLIVFALCAVFFEGPWMLVAHIRAVRRIRRRQCVKCGYSLIATTSTCPECGRQFGP